jgi:hypothetical protein
MTFRCETVSRPRMCHVPKSERELTGSFCHLAGRRAPRTPPRLFGWLYFGHYKISGGPRCYRKIIVPRQHLLVAAPNRSRRRQFEWRFFTLTLPRAAGQRYCSALPARRLSAAALPRLRAPRASHRNNDDGRRSSTPSSTPWRRRTGIRFRC